MAQNSRRFDKELQALRQMIQASATPFARGRAEQAARVERARHDLMYFGETYFPHYVKSAPSALHRYICERYSAMILAAQQTGEGDREADAAPRGNAKSTWTTLILPIWAAVYKHRRFALIVSETATQSDDFISYIRLELESNERLKQDFPEAFGEGPVWKAGTIITRNGVKIRGAGAGQKLRGMRHGAYRPDLVIGDDLENDEAVLSVDQRAKLSAWFFKALMKIGQKDTVYIVVGTILHYESLLSDLLARPGWKGRKFQAVIAWSSATKLWERWEALLSDISMGKDEAERRADAFFMEHAASMLAGAQVLWPEVEDYYYLMKMRVSDGPAAFDSEKQNEPINPADCMFAEAWIRYYDEDEATLAGLPHYGTCDPSMGKKSSRRDPSAIICGKALSTEGGKTIYLTAADIERRHPDKIMSDILAYHERERFATFGVEAVAFQEFFAGELARRAHASGLTLNMREIRPHSDKHMRIQRLQPWIKNGWIRFRRDMQSLVRQLTRYPKADHDDGPDALEMLVGLIESGADPIEYEALGEGRMMRGAGCW